MREPLADRAYRALLRVLPFDFRGDFGPEMEEVFHEQLTVARGPRAVFALWFETAVDLLRTAPSEHLAILRQDARYAVRVMRREIGYVLLSILVLGLGIGASAALFSVIDAILIRPLPYANGRGLVFVRQLTPQAGITEIPFSVHEIADFRAKNRTLQALAEYHSMTFTLLDPENTERVRTGVVSADFFDIFGVKPILGRGFTQADDAPGATPVLLMSYEYWQKHGSNRSIVGRTVRMNDREHTVIGVMPQMPQFPDENDVFMPTSACPFRSAPNFIANRSSRMMLAFGLLKPGIAADEASADLKRVAADIARLHPEVYPAEMGYTADSVPLRDELTQRARPMLWLLMAASLAVLLIACANVANLTLARVGRRDHELAVRAAMGAARARLLRQFLTEHFIVAICAAAVGVTMAALGLHVLTDFAARLTPRAREITMDRSVLLFAVALAMATSVFFGSICTLAPRNLRSGLNDASGPPRMRFRNALVVSQVALSAILLAGAGLLTRSMLHLHRVPAGFAQQNTLAFSVNMNWSRPGAEQRAIAQRLLERVTAEPDVLSAALASSYPFDPHAVEMGPIMYQFHVNNQNGVSALRMVTPRYFETLGVPIISGRAFSDHDDDRAEGVAIVSESLARRYWGDRDPIGQTIRSGNERFKMKIVGVAGDVKELGPARETPDEVYLSIAQDGGPVLAVLVRTSADLESAATRLRRAIHAADSDIAINDVQTLQEARGDSVRVNRLITDLLAAFATVALAIAVSGVGGILALSVARRGREIAIRMALGARPGEVMRMVVGQGMKHVLFGLAIGIGVALLVTGALRELLFQITPTDPVTFIGVIALLIVTALGACLIPATRATRIEPSAALRSE
jgi:putative ABC transport system permease protein